MLNQTNNKYSTVSDEFRRYSHLRAISMLIVTISLFAIGAGLYFIYDNIYSTIAKTEAELNINPIITQEAIDFEKYDSVKTSWDEKQNAKQIEIKRNPFYTPTTTQL